MTHTLEESPPGAAPVPPRQGARVLVLEAACEARLAVLCVELGYKVERAATVEEVLSLDATSFDLIVACAGVGDGGRRAQMLEAWRDRCGLAAGGLPLLLVVEHDDPAVALSPGVDDFVSFPCDECYFGMRLDLALKRRTSTSVTRPPPLDARSLQVFHGAAYGRNAANACLRQEFRPLGPLNGDLFLAARAPNGALMLLLGDLAGHGLGAALLAPAMAAAFHDRVQVGLDAAAVLHGVDGVLKRLAPVGMFMALQFVMIDPTGELCLANCAMPNIWLCAEEMGFDAVPSHSIAAGVQPSLFLEDGMVVRRWQEGMRILLATDGVVESRNADGEMFGERRLRSALRMAVLYGEPLLEAVLAELDEFAGGVPASDDISVVEIVCSPDLFVDAR